MIVRKMTVYRCEHCRRLFEKRPAAVKHEDRCKKNPDNFRNCFSCKNLIKTKASLVDDGREVETLFCNARKVFLHTPINVKKGRIYDTGELSYPMPIECDLFVSCLSFDPACSDVSVSTSFDSFELLSNGGR